MPDQRTISPDEAERILRLEEGHYLDVKRIEIKPGKLSESISAFANASGGEIFVGIAEDSPGRGRVKRWAGFPDMEAANAHIQVIDAMATLGNHYSARFLQCPEQSGQVLHLTVLKTRDILRATDGFPYVRRNALNVRIPNDDMLQRLRLDKGIATFENETVNVPLEAITNSIVTLEFLINVVPSAEPEDWLRSQFLILDGKPTVAWLVLFSDEPQAALPKRSAIKIYRYISKEEQGTRETLAGDPMTVESAVVVYVAHSPLASPEQIVMAYLEGHEEITNRVGRDLAGIRSENSMKEVFLRLKKRNMIEPVPEKKGSASAWRRFTGSNGDMGGDTPGAAGTDR